MEVLYVVLHSSGSEVLDGQCSPFDQETGHRYPCIFVYLQLILRYQTVAYITKELCANIDVPEVFYGILNISQTFAQSYVHCLARHSGL